MISVIFSMLCSACEPRQHRHSMMGRPVSSSGGGGGGHAADLNLSSIQPRPNFHHWEGLKDRAESIFYEGKTADL